jgi:hypothetical protein
MLLQVVTLSRDVCGYFHTVRKSNSGDLSNRGVRLLWSLGSDLGAYASLEWRVVENGSVLNMVKTLRQGNSLALTLGLVSILLD